MQFGAKSVWQIGIDEAGYGPILGPFVMAAVAIGRAGTLRAKEPWKLLEKVTDRARGRKKPADSEQWFVIADSKQVHRGSNRLAELEFHTLPVLWPWLDSDRRFPTLLERLSVSGLPPDMALACYRAALPLPICHGADEIMHRAEIWRDRLHRAGLVFDAPRIFVLLPPTINALIAKHGTKAVLPWLGWRELLSAWNAIMVRHTLAETCEVWCDRLGGRQYYAGLLCEALTGWQLQHYLETPGQCRYVFSAEAETSADGSSQAVSQKGRRPCRRSREQTVPIRCCDADKSPALGERRWTVVVTPLAETRSFAVALASMISKYIREVFMHHFNKYWQENVPGLRPTAGYPNDGKRFLRDIEPARRRLGLSQAELRRCR